MLSYKVRQNTNVVVLHDSHTSPSQSDLEHFLAVKGRQMGLLDIGYHYLILRDGKLVECRPHTVQGTHLRHKHNRDSIGVCLAGGLSERLVPEEAKTEPYPESFTPFHIPEDNFTEAQMATLWGLMDYLARFYGGLPLKGHSELLPRLGHQCPARNMDEVRKWLTP